MTDHGVVLLTGEALVNWIRIPRNRSLLPQFLQNQLGLGEEVSELAGTVERLGAAITGCLERQPGWISKYSDYMRNSPSLGNGTDSKLACDIALAEASFGELLWSREFNKAASVLAKIQEQAVQFSQFTGAWLTMWWGYAVEMTGDTEAAYDLYRRAFALNSNTLRLPLQQGASTDRIQQQVVNVAGQLQVGASKGMTLKVPQRLQQELFHLNGSGSVPQIEEALRCLGQYLGLESTRPDKEHGTGPDVLWRSNDGFAVVMEVKTDKQESSRYTKSDLGQLRDHVQWVSDRYETTEVADVFVGPLLAASDQANPSQEMVVIELEQFDSVGKKLVSTIQDVAENALPLKLVEELNGKMTARGLLWPSVYKLLEKSLLLELTAQ